MGRVVHHLAFTAQSKGHTGIGHVVTFVRVWVVGYHTGEDFTRRYF